MANIPKKRGRKSLVDLAVIPGNFGEGRPPPPSDLTERQADIWRDVIGSEAVDFFATAALKFLLADYCRHRESAENVNRMIDAFKPDWLKDEDGAKRYHALLRMRELETRAGVTIATKLRLTNQSRYTTKSAATASRPASKAKRPWEA